MPVHSRAKLTYEDYQLLPDDGKRHEIIDGEHYMSPSPSVRHQRVLINILFALESHARAERVGQVLLAPTDVILSDSDVVQPDILFVSSARQSIITEKNLQGSPDLVIEILSESSRKVDEITKRRRYEMFSIPEYWVVDPELETIKVYRLQTERYVRAAEFSVEAADTLSTPLLPGFAIPLTLVFQKA